MQCINLPWIVAWIWLVIPMILKSLSHYYSFRQEGSIGQHRSIIQPLCFDWVIHCTVSVCSPFTIWNAKNKTVIIIHKSKQKPYGMLVNGYCDLCIIIRYYFILYASFSLLPFLCARSVWYGECLYFYAESMDRRNLAVFISN